MLKKLYSVSSVSAAAIAITLPALAQVQDTPEQPGDKEASQRIEEIVVTALRREETLQDAPISINAQTEEFLRRSGVTNLSELANNVASFTVQDLGPGQSQVAIRGISAGQIVRDQPGVKEQVGVYLDESVISLSLFTPDLVLFDLERVEVLRGPQGTLFGAGSQAGTVRYITNKPDFTTFSVTGEANGRAVDGGSLGGDIKAAVNIPIVEDRMALRVVGYFEKLPGFIDAIQPGGELDDDVNDGERFGGRIALSFEPFPGLTVTPRAVYQEVEADGFNRQDLFNILANEFTTTRPPVEIGEREQFTQLEETFTDEFLLLDAEINWDFADFTLTSITSYTDRDVLQIRDATQLTGSITGQPGTFTPEGFGPEVFTLDAPLFDRTEVEVFTQEARIGYDAGGRFDGTLGVFYSDIERDFGQRLPVDGFTEITGIASEGPLASTDVLFFSQIPFDFTQIAVFGEGTYRFTEQLAFTAGLRWFDFDEERVLNFDGIFAATTVGEEGETESDGVAPRVILSYEPDPDVLLTAQVAKGFRLGGINDPLNEPLCSEEDLATFGGRESFDDEVVWNYEIGAKTSLAGGQVTVNGAVFYADINDLQVTIDAGTCSSRIIFNVPESRSVGGELEIVAQPTPNWNFGLSASYIDSQIKSTVTSTTPAGVTTAVGGIEDGNRLPTVPEFQLSATATYFRPITNRLEGFVTATVQHVGSRFTQLSDQAEGFGEIALIPIGDPTIDAFRFDPELDPYQIGNIRIGIVSELWEAAFFVTNVWDEVAELSLDRERGGAARIGILTNQPRTFGLTLRSSF